VRDREISCMCVRACTDLCSVHPDRKSDLIETLALGLKQNLFIIVANVNWAICKPCEHCKIKSGLILSCGVQ